MKTNSKILELASFAHESFSKSPGEVGVHSKFKDLSPNKKNAWCNAVKSVLEKHKEGQPSLTINKKTASSKKGSI